MAPLDNNVFIFSSSNYNDTLLIYQLNWLDLYK